MKERLNDPTIPTVGAGQAYELEVKGPGAPGVRDAFQRAGQIVDQKLEGRPARVTLELVGVSQEIENHPEPRADFLAWRFRAIVRPQ